MKAYILFLSFLTYFDLVAQDNIEEIIGYSPLKIILVNEDESSYVTNNSIVSRIERPRYEQYFCEGVYYLRDCKKEKLMLKFPSKEYLEDYVSHDLEENEREVAKLLHPLLKNGLIEITGEENIKKLLDHFTFEVVDGSIFSFWKKPLCQNKKLLKLENGQYLVVSYISGNNTSFQYGSLFNDFEDFKAYHINLGTSIFEYYSFDKEFPRLSDSLENELFTKIGLNSEIKTYDIHLLEEVSIRCHNFLSHQTYEELLLPMIGFISKYYVETIPNSKLQMLPNDARPKEILPYICTPNGSKYSVLTIVKKSLYDLSLYEYYPYYYFQLLN
ncbi:hypothetical protein R9C00_08550 [Flammeovirgaceae bacterium SG7u.111]|nr:hypothetical protein [Flammeovirgaceae bacterium SG7u.132]WPO37496.1 hypothetical protein R9C00_08550 [Flammeovirgaceae bacterium SG7u.111]